MRSYIQRVDTKYELNEGKEPKTVGGAKLMFLFKIKPAQTKTKKNRNQIDREVEMGRGTERKGTME